MEMEAMEEHRENEVIPSSDESRSVGDDHHLVLSGVWIGLISQVSLIDMEGPTVLYQKHFARELCTGVISMQFETCSFHGFEKNVIVVATKDSSVLAIESDTGNTLGSGLVGPTKPSKALFMQVLDGKESVLICSEKATYVYLLQHVVQHMQCALHWTENLSWYETVTPKLLFWFGYLFGVFRRTANCILCTEDEQFELDKAQVFKEIAALETQALP
ncbi:hypothetical protein RHMOL_Rhmol06G0032800 [Rhododendron molle]|uniref:Uncharacterized protein n=1 Tax=Rhododendron molle TaxID=49168 RepID=A0ACC0N8E3_RHOML|nr:hypothetical protein RHMOL_Rhmol06G0032800 [Rhododendron molle]